MNVNKFEQLGLNSALAKNIEKNGITEPTVIQSKSIPEILKGNDVVGESSTGSGKTIAFGAGILNKDSKKGLFALVLTPTREIAHQVSDVFKTYSDNLKVLPVYGGVGIGPQIDKLKKANIVVATPGRMLDHIERNTIDLSKIQTLVLDEADKMFEMGFIDDVKKIMSYCPKDKQSLLFSATFSKEVNEIAKRFMNNPVRIKGEARVDPEKLHQIYYNVPVNLKFSLLVDLLKHEESHLSIVFCNTKRMVDVLQDSLKLNGVKARSIHGGLTQAKRKQNLDALKEHRVEILLCTDVAARGLDIPNVSHVYNYDLPNDATDYVHRSGRTARAGKDGLVINLLTRNDHDNFSKILREYPKLRIENEETPDVEKAEMVKSKPQRGRGGFRPSRGNPRDGYSARSGFRGRSGSRQGGRFGGSRRDSSDSRRSSDDKPRRSFSSNRSDSKSSSDDKPRRSFSSNRSDSRRSYSSEGSRSRSGSGFSRGSSRSNSREGSRPSGRSRPNNSRDSRGNYGKRRD